MRSIFSFFPMRQIEIIQTLIKTDLQLGETISDLRDRFGEFSTATSLKLSYLAIECIEEIHKIGFIHRGKIVISIKLLYYLSFFFSSFSFTFFHDEFLNFHSNDSKRKEGFNLYFIEIFSF